MHTTVEALREAGSVGEGVTTLRSLSERASTVWAVARTAGIVATAPISVPALAVAARRTANDSLTRIAGFGEHLRAVAAGEPPTLPAPLTRFLDGEQRWIITSDLHRGPEGRYDWPGRQGTKEVYVSMLRHYATRGWGLVENGDVEDFWMAATSAWGAVYDIARVAGGLDVDPGDSLPATELRDVLDQTIANNALIYELLLDGFVRERRYHRTIGNHDEAYTDESLCEVLEGHLPGARPVDTILFTPGAVEAPGIGEVDAVISHGHLTDSWNGPVYSPLGRAITWIGMGLGELGASGTEGLPDEESVDRLLDGRGRNRLITLDPRFGGNRRFDSLDEERLFSALELDPPPGGWPWLVLGHTHYPMFEPTTSRGGTVRYANSGCGVLRRAVSALEWDPANDPPLQLVLWVDEGDGAVRVELDADESRLRPRNRGD